MKGWTKSDWQEVSREFDEICKKLTSLLKQEIKVNSPLVADVISLHYLWIKKFWEPNKVSYFGLADCYIQFEWERVFKPYHPELAHYLSQAMKLFAEKL
jgi:hypothetical protein